MQGDWDQSQGQGHGESVSHQGQGHGELVLLSQAELAAHCKGPD